MSIRNLVLATLAVVFAVMLLFTLIFGAYNDRSQAEHFAGQQINNMVQSYFDSLNTLMMTGNMASRNLVRDKLLSNPAVLDARIIRSATVEKLYGKGSPEEQARDELERLALKGQKIEQITQGDNGRVLTLIKPLAGTANYNGLDCLVCHQSAEGEVLGAVRIDYSLAETDSQVNRNLFTSATFQIVLMVIGFLIIAWVLRQVVANRLHRLHDSLEQVSKNADLSIELEVIRDDEIGSVANAYNTMMVKINDTLIRAVDGSKQVHNAATQFASMAKTHDSEVLSQKCNTEMVATAMNEMAASAQEVKSNATSTSGSSKETSNDALKGQEESQEAVDGIETLSNEVQAGSDRIKQLNQCSDEVAAVLEVISSIADQTNLLALNAAIEAARAGEHGRGFAVVADEVRSLATRTQDSTGEIRTTIETLRHEASGCVDIMDNATQIAQTQQEKILSVADSFKKIAVAISNINDLNVLMEHASDEQSQVAESINRNLVDITNSAESTAVDSQRSAKIAEDLVLMAVDLESSISQFRLKQSH